MDRQRFSFIAHRDHDFCNPVSEIKIGRAIDLLALNARDRVVDFGAGKCELLIRLVERYSVHATGVEPSPLFAGEARQRACKRVAEDGLVIAEQDAESFVAQNTNARFHAALCIGSTHAFGGYAQTLDALKAAVIPGGTILVGEGFWKRPPGDEYLEALGAKPSDLTGHAENVERAVANGLVPLWAGVASDDDWDEYEWRYARSVETFVAENPDGPDAESMLQRIRTWRQTYLRWGRDTLGFGLYLFSRPHTETPESDGTGP